MDEENEIELKIVLMGNSGVGKTCLINRYVKNNFNDKPISTVGAMFLTQTLHINNKTYKLQVNPHLLIP